MATRAYLRSAAPATVAYAGTAVVISATCEACGAVDEWRITSRLPPADIVPKHFAQKGWDMRKRPICPACQSKTKGANDVSLKPADLKVVETSTEASEAAKKAKRLIYAALEDYYNDQAKAYRTGHTDKTIAAELGVSESFVKTIREQDFGPLTEPSEVADIRREMTELASALGKLQTRLNNLSVKQGWRE